MDTIACFSNGHGVDVDLGDCSFPLTAEPGAAGMNVALVGPPGGAGICSADACLIPLDSGIETGWEESNGRAYLPEAVCEGLESGDVSAVAVTTACPTKLPSLPTCGPWSSVGTNPGTFDAPPPLGVDFDGAGGEGGGAGSSGVGGEPGVGGTVGSGGAVGGGGALPVAGAAGGAGRAGSAGEAGAAGSAGAGGEAAGAAGAVGVGGDSGAGGIPGSGGNLGVGGTVGSGGATTMDGGVTMAGAGGIGGNGGAPPDCGAGRVPGPNGYCRHLYSYSPVGSVATSEWLSTPTSSGAAVTATSGANAHTGMGLSLLEPPLAVDLSAYDTISFDADIPDGELLEFLLMAEPGPYEGSQEQCTWYVVGVGATTYSVPLESPDWCSPTNCDFDLTVSEINFATAWAESSLDLSVSAVRLEQTGSLTVPISAVDGTLGINDWCWSGHVWGDAPGYATWIEPPTSSLMRLEASSGTESSAGLVGEPWPPVDASTYGSLEVEVQVAAGIGFTVQLANDPGVTAPGPGSRGRTGRPMLTTARPTPATTAAYA